MPKKKQSIVNARYEQRQKAIYQINKNEPKPPKLTLHEKEMVKVYTHRNLNAGQMAIRILNARGHNVSRGVDKSEDPKYTSMVKAILSPWRAEKEAMTQEEKRKASFC